MLKKNILLVFGTRPEAIKMCPLVKELRTREEFNVTVCVTGQHESMLQQVLDVFEIEPDFNLKIMKPGQTLSDITSSVLDGLNDIYDKVDPDIVLVHGDTSTSYAAALSAFYRQIAVGHVEAGLRTYNIKSPWPEEFNRQSIDLITDYYFVPTEKAKNNLLNENVEENKIYITGNTAIDALKYTIQDDFTDDIIDWSQGSRLILITAHRRENLGQPMRNMFRAIRRVLEEHDDVKAVYPIHMNPIVRGIAHEELCGIEKLKIIDPLQVLEFHNLMNNSYMILTDSGGIQEEAPSLGKPVLVMRDTTERPEGIDAGTLKLVGTEEDVIYEAFSELLNNQDVYDEMSLASNPYGNGDASEKIANALLEIL